MLLKEKRSTPGLQILSYVVFAIGVLLALALRISLFHVVTGDYTTFLSRWYLYLKDNGGFAALKDNFSNYNVPYLYLLTIATYVPVPELTAIKTISICFDAVLAIFTYLLLRLKFQRPYVPLIGVLVVLFAPTIVINSAAWGQADATYVGFCLGSLYFLLKGRLNWACIFFGLALSFKLQAIFFLPVLLVFVVKQQSYAGIIAFLKSTNFLKSLKSLEILKALRPLIFIPLVFLLLLVPAYIAGRSAGSLLSIYPGQISSSNGVGSRTQFQLLQQGTGRKITVGDGNGPRGGFAQGNGPRGGFVNGNGTGNFPGQAGGGLRTSTVTSDKPLTYNAATFYQWLPATTPTGWKYLGIGLAGIFIIVVAFLVWKSEEQITTAIILNITMSFALTIPFLLPEMHERYFFLADVVSIIYAFYFPRRFYLPIVMQACSLLSYAPYFQGKDIVDLSYPAFAILVIAFITFMDLLLALYPGLRKHINTAAFFVEKEEDAATASDSNVTISTYPQ
jgi:Gpi18-like mannosyltransferase